MKYLKTIAVKNKLDFKPIKGGQQAEFVQKPIALGEYEDTEKYQLSAQIHYSGNYRIAEINIYEKPKGEAAPRELPVDDRISEEE